MASKPYWESWFKGLTQCFLGVKVPKQLLLAGSDRMDKELTIAQMQGKESKLLVEEAKEKGSYEHIRTQLRNQKSLEFITPSFIQNKNIYPEKSMLDKCEFLEDVGDFTPIYSKIWTEIKSN